MQYYTLLTENLYRYAVHIDKRALKYINNQTKQLVDIAIESTSSIREETFIKI